MIIIDKIDSIYEKMFDVPLSVILPMVHSISLECKDYEGYCILSFWGRPLNEDVGINQSQYKEIGLALEQEGVERNIASKIVDNAFMKYTKLRSIDDDQLLTLTAKEMEDTIKSFDNLLNAVEVPQGLHAKWEKSKENSGGNGNSGNRGNTENGDSNSVDNTQDGDNSNETLNTYTIKYDANGGKTKNASVKVVKGGSVKLPAAEREGYTFKGWYTDRQIFIGTEGETYKPSRSISLYARWEKAENDGKDDSDNNSTENTNDKDNKNTSDKNQNTSGTGNRISVANTIKRA